MVYPLLRDLTIIKLVFSRFQGSSTNKELTQYTLGRRQIERHHCHETGDIGIFNYNIISQVELDGRTVDGVLKAGTGVCIDIELTIWRKVSLRLTLCCYTLLSRLVLVLSVVPNFFVFRQLTICFLLPQERGVSLVARQVWRFQTHRSTRLFTTVGILLMLPIDTSRYCV